MGNSRAAQNYSAGDIDEIASGNEIAQPVEKLGHGLQRENVSGKKDAGQNGQERQLHGFGLGVGFAGNQNAQRQRNKKVGKRKKRQQKHAAMNRDVEREAHEGQNHAQFKKADAQIRQ